MKSALSDYLVICDMDNTLLTAKEGLPSCNRTVIQLFTEMGDRPAAGIHPGGAARDCAFHAGDLLQRRTAVRFLDRDGPAPFHA